ncbi:MAG: sulfotransferase domain-containing protein [Deltaproteobacteria bacterium]|nr:sulfotransferase domain-containing protein [Deltaproteobacteria bacterium]
MERYAAARATVKGLHAVVDPDGELSYGPGMRDSRLLRTLDELGAADIGGPARPSPFRRGARNVLVAGLPKSGSSFVTLALARYLDAPVVPAALTRGGEVLDHRLNLARLLRLKLAGGDSVSAQHAVANAETLHLIRTFDLRTVVTTRPVLDALVSLRDHVQRDQQDVPRLSLPDTLVFLPYAPPHFYRLLLTHKGRELTDFIVEVFAPWFFLFLLSWEHARRTKAAPVHVVRYEDLARDEGTEIVRALEYLGIEPDVSRIGKVLRNLRRDSPPALLNVGVAGRGRATLTRGQIARVRAIGHLFAPRPVVEALL